jgi:hypothetical protein
MLAYFADFLVSLLAIAFIVVIGLKESSCGG